MKWKQFLALGVGAALGWTSAAWRGESPDSTIPATGTHAGISIEQVQALSELVTTRVNVADVTETTLQGRTGGIKAALLVKGDFLLGIDLSQARFASVDVTTRAAVLLLPSPRVSSPRLDHNRTRLFAVAESGLWQLTPDDGRAAAAVVNRAYRDAQRYVERTCDDPTLVVRARQQAESVLRAFFATAGWKLAIRWQR